MADVTAADVIRKMQTMMTGDWRYRFGAEVGSPSSSGKTVDCSEATEAAVRWAAEEKSSGLRLTDGSFAQHDACHKAGTLIPLAEARETPGALVFLSHASNVTPGMGRDGIYHVGLILNRDTVLEACCSDGDVIRPCNWGARSWYKLGGLIPGVTYEGDDMPLTEADIKAIADAVWERQYGTSVDNHGDPVPGGSKPITMQQAVAEARGAAIDAAYAR